MSERGSSSGVGGRGRPSRLRRWVALSAGAHLAALAVLIPLLAQAPEVETQLVTEVDLVDLKPRTRAAVAPAAPSPREAQPPGKPRRARRRRAVQASRPAQQQPPADDVPELLVMRQPVPAAPEPTPPPPPPDKNRFASFWGQHRQSAPPPATRERLASMEVTRYADGGRVLRSTDGPPNQAAMGLLDLAAGKLGDRSGSQACNPYRGWRGSDRRELILIVDTSGSVVRNRHAPASLVCAAGAALAALQRGFSVTVVNFSSITQHYGPTEDIDVIYRALSTFQAQGTVLPRPELLKLTGSGPRDYVLISDAAIQNLQQVIPSYGKALRTNPRNRALLYYLGGGQMEGLDPAEALELIQRSGFKAEQVNTPRAGS